MGHGAKGCRSVALTGERTFLGVSVSQDGGSRVCGVDGRELGRGVCALFFFSIIPGWYFQGLV